MTEINWGYNCLTSGVHHGRPDPIWDLPIFHGVTMFDSEGLKRLVVARIYSDAMQFVEHGEHSLINRHITTVEWANRVKALAEEKFDSVFRATLEETLAYYDTPGWYKDLEVTLEQVEKNRLNRHYNPRHSHDSINMLCRILGTRCSREATA
jgi:hypothetical protein